MAVAGEQSGISRGQGCFKYHALGWHGRDRLAAKTLVKLSHDQEQES
jgi:hypothetical protein